MSKMTTATRMSALGSLLALGLGLSQSSCSLSKYDQTECKSNAECREAFGLTSVCGASGFCEELSLPPRCRNTYPEDLFQRPEKYQNAILIGSLMDRSVAKKVARERSIRLAVKQADEAGGLDGRVFGLVSCTIEENNKLDDKDGASAAVADANFLVHTLGVAAIVGPSGSGNTTKVFQSLQGTGTLVISPSATSPALTSLEPANVSDNAPGLLWRTAPPDSYQGRIIAQDMIKRGVKKVAVVHQVDSYGQGLADVFNEVFSANGGHVQLVPWSDGNALAEATVTVASMDVEEVLFISSKSADIAAFLNAAVKNTGYDNKHFFLPDAAASEDLFQGDAAQAKPLFPRIRGTRVKPLTNKDFAYGTFVAAYGAEYNNEDVTQYSFTAQSFDAAWLVMYGSAWSVARTNKVTGKGIAQGLRKISCNANGAKPCNVQPFKIVPSSWPGIISQFKAGSAIDLEGASGNLDYDLKTEETNADIEIWTVDDQGIISAATDNDPQHD